MSLGAKRRRLASRVYRAPELTAATRDEPGRRATRGTEHTVGLARAAGLTVRREVWHG